MRKRLFVTLLGLVACTPPLLPLEVSLTQPSTAVYTNGSITIQAVVGGNPDSVELLKNDTVLVALNSPYNYTWNTSSEPEATYSLKVRVKRGTTQLESSSQNVVVDRTAPTLTSRTPSNNADNVFLADEISLTASEDLLPASVSSSTVFLKKGSNIQTNIPVQVSLPTPNKILLRPTQLPVLPETFQVQVSAVSNNTVTDLAGNALQIPSAVFTAPDWHFVGGTRVGKDADLSDQAIALGSDAQPVVAYLEEAGANHNIRVKRFDGTLWQELGSSVQSAAKNTLNAPLLAMDGNNPVVAWLEGANNAKVIYVKRWDGTAWQQLGAAVNTSINSASALGLAVSSSGVVFVSRLQLSLLVAATQLRVSRLNGSTWQAIGDAFLYPANSSMPRLALDKLGLAAVSYSQQVASPDVATYLRRWDGTTWTETLIAQDAVQTARQTRLLFDTQDKAIICTFQAQCRRFDGTAQNLGVNDSQTSGFVMQLDTNGRPIVASTLDPEYGVVVKRILPNGNAQINSTIDPADAPSQPNLILDSQDNPIVVWIYSQGNAQNSRQIHVRRANRIP